MKVIQWNLRGVGTQFEELQRLCHNLQPGVVALQETLLRPEKPFTISGFNTLNLPAFPTDSNHGVT